jgi:hypothetical protein
VIWDTTAQPLTAAEGDPLQLLAPPLKGERQHPLQRRTAARPTATQKMQCHSRAARPRLSAAGGASSQKQLHSRPARRGGRTAVAAHASLAAAPSTRPPAATAGVARRPSASSVPRAAAGQAPYAAPPPQPAAAAAFPSTPATPEARSVLLDARNFLERELQGLFAPGGELTRARYSAGMTFQDPITSLEGIEAYALMVRWVGWSAGWFGRSVGWLVGGLVGGS